MNRTSKTIAYAIGTIIFYLILIVAVAHAFWALSGPWITSYAGGPTPSGSIINLNANFEAKAITYVFAVAIVASLAGIGAMIRQSLRHRQSMEVVRKTNLKHRRNPQ